MSTEITIQTSRHHLSQVQRQITAQLDPIDRQYVELRQENPMSALSMMEVRVVCHKIIKKAFFDFIGGQTDDKVLTAQTLALQDEFKDKRLRQLTVSEVVEAFRKGIRNEYGSYFGMCGRSYHFFLNSYLEEEKRAQAWIKYQELLEKSFQSENKTPEQKIAESKHGLLNLFNQYKATKSLGVCPWAYSAVLAELVGEEVEYRPGKFYKTFVPDPAVREMLNAEAEAEFDKEHKSPPAETSIYDFEERVNKKVSAGDAVMRSIVQAGLKKEDALANKKKEVALRWYFDKLIEEGKELQL